MLVNHSEDKARSIFTPLVEWCFFILSKEKLYFDRDDWKNDVYQIVWILPTLFFSNMYLFLISIAHWDKCSMNESLKWSKLYTLNFDCCELNDFAYMLWWHNKWYLKSFTHAIIPQYSFGIINIDIFLTIQNFECLNSEYTTYPEGIP